MRTSRATEAEFEEMQQRTRGRIVREPGRSPKRETDKVASAPPKYRNRKTEVDGVVFDSKKEAGRYQELVALQNVGLIRDLTLQVRLPLEIDGERICVYVCDFRYFVKNQGLGFGKWIYEDTKGMRTPVYLLKKKLVKALLKIEILET